MAELDTDGKRSAETQRPFLWCRKHSSHSSAKVENIGLARLGISGGPALHLESQESGNFGCCPARYSLQRPWFYRRAVGRSTRLARPSRKPVSWLTLTPIC